MRITVLLLSLLLLASKAWGGAPITVGEMVKIPSKILQEERTILVSLPGGYARSTERYPVLYFTDGDGHFTALKGITDFLAGNGLMPNVILVGVTNTDRVRDLTPTRVEVRRRNGVAQAFPTSGGGARFLEFFEKEVFPYVENTYRTAPHRLFAGHSFGGLLALHALAVRPELFQAYISASPSLDWDNDYPLRMLKERLKAKGDLPRTLFVTMANEEKNISWPTHFDRLRQLLKGSRAKGFVWETKAMPEEDHGSVVMRSYYWGLHHIFDGWRMRGDGPLDLDAIKDHFQTLTQRMGYPIQPREAEVNQVGYGLLGGGRLKDALEVFQYNAELHPTSPNVHDSLGEALEQAKRPKEAQASYAKAVELALKAGDPLLETFRKNRDRVAEALK
jgi:hypothetical protein